MTLIEISPPAFDVDQYIAYATEDNFTGEPVYARAGCYLHPDAAEYLHVAIDLAAALDLRFLIFDAFRPSEAQWALWNHTPDPEFLADPRRGSPHSRGVAVDLTLIDKNGKVLKQVTEMDVSRANIDSTLYMAKGHMSAAHMEGAIPSGMPPPSAMTSEIPKVANGMY